MGSFQVQLFPIYGFALGINYASGAIEEFYYMDEDERMIQFFIGPLGISIVWFKQYMGNIKRVKPNEPKPNEHNPRYINKANFKKLVNSLKEFP